MFIYLLVFSSFNKSHYNSLVCTYDTLDSKGKYTGFASNDERVKMLQPM